MEKSIKRVEKLVHATNSALAQMKFSLMFDDDVNGGGGGGVDGKFRNAKAFDSAAALGESFFDGDDLKQCQSEFNTEANEVLAKLESTYASTDAARKNAKAVDRIKEINRKMNSLRLEQSRREETEQSRQKLLNLISEEKFSPGLTSSGESVQSRAVVNREKSSSSRERGQQPPPPRRTASLLTVARSPSGRSKEELKSKILETQEIVNRGFQTARQLAQKVETMSKSEKKEKTPSTGKTVSEINLKSLEGKTESNETVSRRRGREEEAEKKKRKECESVERANARLIDVKRKETEGGRPNLRMQRLPSLHIKGGLQLQKVHSLEIPAAGGGGADAAFPKANTAVSFLSHERVENEKMGDAIERVRRENCCCGGGDPRPGNYVECFNCGKLIRIRETRVDPQKVDEILQKCNYDVFDPRIDEFVERCAGEIRGRKTQPQDTVSVNAGTVTEPEITRKATSRKKKERRRSSSTTLRRLSDQLLRRYKEETENIENNHMQLDNILQHLFRQVDESREVFEKCHLFRDRKPEFGQMPLLTATKPVLVSLEGASSVGDARRSEKSEKQQVPKNRFQGEGRKNQVEKSEPAGRKASVIHVSPPGSGKSERRETPGKLNLSSSGHTISEIEKLEDGRSSASSSSTGWSSRRARNVLETVEDTRVEHRRKKKTGKPRKPATQPEPREVVEEEAHSDTVSSASSRKSNRTNEKTNPVASRREETERRTVGTPSSKSEGKGESSSENNYESDFESVTNEPNECVAECEEEEPEGNLGINKLSTISEVDSELERKLSDDQKTGRSTRTDETLPPPEDTKEEEEVGGDEYLPPPNLGTSAEGERVEGASPKTADTSVKSTPTELVTTLKDILSALQDQFVRTESLAEKLTESVRPESGAGPGGVLGAWKKPIGAEMMENLRSARKDPAGGGQECPSESKKSAEENVAIASADSLSDEGGSSLGEIVVSDRRRRRKKAEKSESSSISECSYLKVDSGGRRSSRVPSARRDISSGSPFKLDVNVQEGILYSEGEIPSDELSGFEQLRTGSVGEGLVAGRRGISSSRTT